MQVSLGTAQLLPCHRLKHRGSSILRESHLEELEQ